MRFTHHPRVARFVGRVCVASALAFAGHAFGQGSVTYVPPRAIGAASIGQGIGSGLGAAFNGVMGMRTASRQLTQEIEQARADFWATFPDKAGHAEAEERLAGLLFEKDLAYLMVPIIIGDTAESVDDIDLSEFLMTTVSGGIDNGPPRGTRGHFKRMLETIRSYIGDQPEEVMMNAFTDQSKFATAFERALPIYMEYVHFRNFAEFERAGRTADFFPTPSSVAYEAIKYGHQTGRSPYSDEETLARLAQLERVHGRERIENACEQLRTHRLVSAISDGIIATQGGEIGLPENLGLDDALVYLIARQHELPMYIKLIYSGLGAKSGDVLPFEDELGREKVLEIAAQVREGDPDPWTARRKFVRLVDVARPFDVPKGGFVFDGSFDGDRLRANIHGTGQRLWLVSDTYGMVVFEADGAKLRDTKLPRPDLGGRKTTGWPGPAVADRRAMLASSALAPGPRGGLALGVAFLLDPDTGAILHILESPLAKNSLHFGSSLALTDTAAIVASSNDQPSKWTPAGESVTAIFNRETGELTRTISEGGAIGADGDLLVIASNSRHTHDEPLGVRAGVYSIATGELLRPLDLSDVVFEGNAHSDGLSRGGDLLELAVSVENGRAALWLPAAQPEGIVRIFDLTTGEIIADITGVVERFSELGNQVVDQRAPVLLHEGRVYTTVKRDDVWWHVFDAETGKPLHRLFYKRGRGPKPIEHIRAWFDGTDVVINAPNAGAYRIGPAVLAGEGE